MTYNRVFSLDGLFSSEFIFPLFRKTRLTRSILIILHSSMMVGAGMVGAGMVGAGSATAQQSPAVRLIEAGAAVSFPPAAEAPSGPASESPFASPEAALPDAPSTSDPRLNLSADPQQSSSSSSSAPSSSSPSSAPPAPDVYQGKQTKRILGILPNFRSVSASSDPPPQSVGEKFKGFAEDSFDYSSLIFVGGVAGFNLVTNSTPEFHEGAKGYARYYWHTFADQTDENLWVGFLLPVAFRQDPRYFTLGHGGAGKRIFYAFSRIVVTRTDSGGSAFNVSEVVGAGAAAGISNLYYPSKERTFGNTGRQWGLNLGLDGATIIFKEFWPDLNRAIFHQKN